VNRELGGEAVLLDLRTGTYYGLNAVGTRFLELVNAGVSLSEIHQTMLAEFDVPADLLQADLLKLAGEMVSKGLLQVDLDQTSLGHPGEQSQ
jgi:Coenzyme PQQ synthesis protein D (PqqD)